MRLKGEMKSESKLLNSSLQEKPVRNTFTDFSFTMTGKFGIVLKNEN